MGDVYTTWESVPEHLMTRKKLAEAGLRLAKGQQPVAIKTGGYGPYQLFDSRQAVTKTPPSEAQRAAIEKARQQAAKNSRCAKCKINFDYTDRGRIAIEDTGNGAYICFMCRDQIRMAAWAKKFLSTPGAIILDTETTGLDDEAEIVEIAVIDVAGSTLLNILVKPTRPIPPEATAIHGITNEEVAASATWGEIDEQLFSLMSQASAIAIYNAEYDLRLIYQSRVAVGLADPGYDDSSYWYHKTDAPPECLAITAKTVCAMEIYAAFYGEWSDYHQSYRWQKLDGGHRALGDCLATLKLIKEMAANE